MRIKILVSILALLILFPTFTFSHSTVSKSVIQKIIPIPLTKQSNEYTCGAAAALSLLSYFGDLTLESELADELNTKPKIGTYYKSMVQLFQSRGYEVQAQENMGLVKLQNFLSEGMPVLCLIQAWEDNVTDYSNHWAIGHYVIAIGFDSERVYFMDPWVIGNYAYLPKEEFVNRWHQLTHQNEHLKQWGMAISKGQAKFNPDEVVYIP